MILLVVSLMAGASPEGAEPPASIAEHLKGWEEVRPVDVDGGLLASAGLWMPFEGGCRRGMIFEHRIEVEACATPRERCAVSLKVDEAFKTSPYWSCLHVDGWGRRGGVSSRTSPNLMLVEHGPDRAVWREARELLVSTTDQRRVHAPCTAATRDADGPNVRDGYRACHAWSGFRIKPRSRSGGAGGVTFRIDEVSDPVDCNEPCPESPRALELEQARAWLRGRLFVRSDSRRIVLTRDPAACEALDPEPLTTWLDLPDDLCVPVFDPSEHF